MTVNLDLVRSAAQAVPGRMDRHGAEARQDRWMLELERAMFATGGTKQVELARSGEQARADSPGETAMALAPPLPGAPKPVLPPGAAADDEDHPVPARSAKLPDVPPVIPPHPMASPVQVSGPADPSAEAGVIEVQAGASSRGGPQPAGLGAAGHPGTLRAASAGADCAPSIPSPPAEGHASSVPLSPAAGQAPRVPLPPVAVQARAASLQPAAGQASADSLAPAIGPAPSSPAAGPGTPAHRSVVALAVAGFGRIPLAPAFALALPEAGAEALSLGNPGEVEEGQEGQEGQEGHHPPALPARTNAEAYAKKLMHVYLAKDGVHAWIRDTEMAPAQIRTVVQAISTEFAASGARLATLCVNGKAVSALSTARDDDDVSLIPQDERSDGKPSLATLRPITRQGDA